MRGQAHPPKDQTTTRGCVIAAPFFICKEVKVVKETRV
mgnify:CR=1 FL=1